MARARLQAPPVVALMTIPMLARLLQVVVSLPHPLVTLGPKPRQCMAIGVLLLLPLYLAKRTRSKASK